MIISGKVQGVYFRHNTQINVGHVIKWCKVGPLGAKVEHVDIKSENYTGEFNGFNVNH